MLHNISWGNVNSVDSLQLRVPIIDDSTQAQLVKRWFYWSYLRECAWARHANRNVVDTKQLHLQSPAPLWEQPQESCVRRDPLSHNCLFLDGRISQDPLQLLGSEDNGCDRPLPLFPLEIANHPSLYYCVRAVYTLVWQWENGHAMLEGRGLVKIKCKWRHSS